MELIATPHTPLFLFFRSKPFERGHLPFSSMGLTERVKGFFSQERRQPEVPRRATPGKLMDTHIERLAWSDISLEVWSTESGRPTLHTRREGSKVILAPDPQTRLRYQALDPAVYPEYRVGGVKGSRKPGVFHVDIGGVPYEVHLASDTVQGSMGMGGVPVDSYLERRAYLRDPRYERTERERRHDAAVRDLNREMKRYSENKGRRSR